MQAGWHPRSDQARKDRQIFRSLFPEYVCLFVKMDMFLLCTDQLLASSAKIRPFLNDDRFDRLYPPCYSTFIVIVVFPSVFSQDSSVSAEREEA